VHQLDIAFSSEGRTLRGWLTVPDGDGPFAGVVMSSGFAGVKEGFLGNPFHQVVAEAGIVVVLFDHPNTGESDGLPRQELDYVAQQRGYQDAITFLATRDEVDAERIGIWGTSYSGGHVLAVAAHDKRVKAVVSQAMTISGHANLVRRHTPAGYIALRRSWAEERVRLAGGQPATLVAAFAEDSESTRYQAARPIEQRRNWRNEVTLRSWELYDECEPAAFIDRIAPTPLLMIVPLDDTMTPAEDAFEAYARALEPKRLITVPGTHYAVYGDQFARTSAAARDWFAEHLAP
jgi:fermentation-respiration switch protein FrsA (DUF1100 family)